MLKKIGLLSLIVANSLFAETTLNDVDSGNYYLWVKNSTANSPTSTDNILTLGLDQTNWNTENSTSIGNSTINYGNYATLLGYGTNNGNIGYTNTNNTIIGAYSQITRDASFSTVIGSQSTNYANNGIIIGSQSTNDGINSVVVGNNSYTNRNNVVSFGNVGTERQLVNIADGTNGADAVNLNQLQTFSTNTLNDSKAYTDLVFSSFSGGGGTTIINNGINEATVDNKDEAIYNKSKDYTDMKIDELENKLSKDIETATSMAIALGVSPVFTDGSKNALGLGFGSYKGTSSVALNGAFKVADNQVLQIGTGLNASARSFKTGYSVSW